MICIEIFQFGPREAEIIIIITRLTVSRVKPLLELHRLCALDAIRIPC